MNIDYKNKYKELKLKFKETVDLAFRMGVEEGMRQGQVQQAAQAQAEAAAAQGQPVQPGQEMNSPEQPDGSELDQHISQLESMVGGQSSNPEEQAAIKKSLEGIKEFRHTLKQASELRKAETAIAAIGKAMKSPFTLGKAATKNLSDSGKKALNDQEKIVADLMKSFEEEEKRAAESITKTLSIEQLLKA